MVVQQFKSILFSFLILLGFMANQSHAIFRAFYWWESPEGNNLFCLDENHAACEVPAVVTHQRIALIDEAKKINAYVVAEDMGHYAGDDSFIRDWTQNMIIKFYRKRSVLVDLVETCKKNGVRCSNVEFRLTAFITDSFFAMTKSGMDLEKEKLPTIQEITKKCDPEYLKKMEKKVADYARTDVGWSHLCGDRGYYTEILKKHDYGIRKFVDEPTRKKMIADLSFPNALCAVGSELLDGEFIHQLYENRSEPNVIIAAGGVHIDNINRVLPQLGYIRKVMPGGSKIRCEYIGSGDTKRVTAASAIDIERCFKWIEDAQKSAYRWHIAKKILIAGVAAVAAWCLCSWFNG